jgi:hypothetical protein
MGRPPKWHGLDLASCPPGSDLVGIPYDRCAPAGVIPAYTRVTGTVGDSKLHPPIARAVPGTPGPLTASPATFSPTVPAEVFL